MNIRLSQLSLQLHSLRSLRNSDQMFAVASNAGYQAVELLDANLVVPNRTIEQLAANGLDAPSAHIGLWALQSRFSQILEACDIIGIKDLVVSSVPRWRRYAGPSYWQYVGATLSDMAARAFETTGVRLGYHNHSWEFRALPRCETPIEILFDSDIRGLLRWQIDISWLSQAGQDLHRWLAYGSGRIDSVHIGEPSGCLTSVWEACASAGANRLIVELNDSHYPEIACRRKLEAISALAAATAAPNNVPERPFLSDTP